MVKLIQAPTVLYGTYHLVSKQRLYSCGLEAALDVIGGKWKVLILWQLQSEPRRFGSLNGLSPDIGRKMLIQTLCEMETGGWFARSITRGSPTGERCVIVTSTNPATLVDLNGDEIHDGCNGHCASITQDGT